MMFRKTKDTVPTILTWLILAVSLCGIGIHFIGCSQEVARIVQDQKQDEEITQLIDAQSSMPPVNQSDELTIRQRKSKDSIIIANRPEILPCAVDSMRTSKNSGGVIYLHCGGESIGDLRIKPNSIPKDTEITVRSYSLEVYGLDVREYQFGPDGLQFSQKAELKLSGDLFKKIDGSPADEIAWLYLNPSTQRWELQNVITKSNDGYFHIDLAHFSIYRAATKSGVSISQGGQVKPNMN